MSLLIPSLLSFGIVAGQLVKLPLANNSGITLLDVVVGLICLIGLIKANLKFSKPPLYIMVGFGFAIIATISLILTPLHLGNQEKLISFFYIVRFSSYLFLGYLVWRKIFNLSVNQLRNSGIILAILGLLQLIFIPSLEFLQPLGWDPHYLRTTSTFLDPNFLGAYLVVTLLFVQGIKKFEFILVYLALLTTFSRGAYLAFLIAFLTLSYLKRSIKLAIISILLFAGLMTGFLAYQQFIASPKGIDRAASAGSRLDTWQQGFLMLEKSPFLGVGFNAYRFGLREYNLALEEFLGSHGASSNDSSLLFVSSTTGILGLLIYLFWLGNLAKLGYNKNPILLSGLLGLFAQSFFANTLFYPPLLLWLVVVSGFEPETFPM